MNLSGISVRELLAKYELEVSDLLVMWTKCSCRWHHPHSQGWQRRQPQRREISNQRPRTQEFARLRLGCGPSIS